MNDTKKKDREKIIETNDVQCGCLVCACLLELNFDVVFFLC